MICKSKIIEGFLFLFNVLFILTGFVLFYNGIAVKQYLNNQPFIDERYNYAGNFSLAISCFIFPIAIIGYRGSIKENSFFMLMFSTTLLLIFFLEVALGVSCFFLNATTDIYLLDILNFYLNAISRKNISDDWDALQKNFFCCGINGPSDWKNFTFDTENVPSSCQYKYPPYVYKVGCLEVYGKYIKSIIFNLEMVGFGTGLVQLLGITLFCYLLNELRKGYFLV